MVTHKYEINYFSGKLTEKIYKQHYFLTCTLKRLGRASPKNKEKIKISKSRLSFLSQKFDVFGDMLLIFFWWFLMLSRFLKTFWTFFQVYIRSAINCVFMFINICIFIGWNLHIQTFLLDCELWRRDKIIPDPSSTNIYKIYKIGIHLTTFYPIRLVIYFYIISIFPSI